MKQPSFEEFQRYAFEKISKKGDDPRNYTEWIMDKFDAWDEAGWQKCVKGKYIPIKIWKSTLSQCLPYRMPNKVKEIKVNKPITITQRLLYGISED